LGDFLFNQGEIVGSFSIWHWLILLVYVAIFVIPGWRIIRKAGYPGAWSVLMLVPLVNIIMLWVFAFTQWPIEKRSA
jgi:hypothetical protein